MRFLNPAMLSWLLVALVPLVLYLFRHRPQRKRVSTLLFFKALSLAHQESAWLRRLKKLLSLALTLLVIAAGAAALARLIVAPARDDVQSVVLLVDRSASMGAIDALGRTRLQAAVAEAEDRLAGVPASVPVAVVAYDARAEVLAPPTLERRDIRRALRAIEPRPIEGKAEPAMKLAREVAAMARPSRVWHLTDAHDSSVPKSDVAVETIALPLERPTNVGVTSFALRRMPMERDRFDAFVQLHAMADRPIEAELQIRLDEKLVGVRTLTMRPGESTRMITPVRAGEGATLSMTAVAKTGGNDALPSDDEVLVRVPPVEPIRVLWVAPEPDPFTELALQSLGLDTQVQVFQGGPGAFPPKEDQRIDVVVFEDWLPAADAWPTALPAIVINPPGSAGPVRARVLGSGLPLETVRPTDERHPLLYGVASGRLALTQTVVMDLESGRSGLEALWVGPSGPVLAAGEVRGQRIAVMGFAPGRSESLPLSASYPLLLGNAVYWATRPAGGVAEAGNNRRTGELLALDDETIVWEGNEAPAEAEATRWAELDRIGLWKTSDGTLGSAAMLSARETLLPSAKPQAAEEEIGIGGWLAGDLTMPLLFLALGALVAESWLFHRHGVY